MNGVECQRIHNIGGRGFFSFTRPPLSFFSRAPSVLARDIYIFLFAQQFLKRKLI
jgi:hypothetical protein